MFLLIFCRYLNIAYFGQSATTKQNEYIQFNFSYLTDIFYEWWLVGQLNWLYTRLGIGLVILRTSSRKGFSSKKETMIWRKQFLYVLYKLQFQNARIILRGILLVIHLYMCQVYRYGYSCFQRWVCDIGSTPL